MSSPARIALVTGGSAIPTTNAARGRSQTSMGVSAGVRDVAGQRSPSCIRNLRWIWNPARGAARAGSIRRMDCRGPLRYSKFLGLRLDKVAGNVGREP